MINLLEALMIICFGLSWPVSIYKSYTSRTAKGKSLVFEVFIWIGYVFGIIRKVIEISSGEPFTFLFYLAFAFYVLNIIEITIDILLYFRNTRLDKKRDEEAAKEEAARIEAAKQEAVKVEEEKAEAKREETAKAEVQKEKSDE